MSSQSAVLRAESQFGWMSAKLLHAIVRDGNRPVRASLIKTRAQQRRPSGRDRRSWPRLPIDVSVVVQQLFRGGFTRETYKPRSTGWLACSRNAIGSRSLPSAAPSVVPLGRNRRPAISDRPLGMPSARTDAVAKHPHVDLIRRGSVR
jgi:hypothetical protein